MTAKIAPRPTFLPQPLKTRTPEFHIPGQPGPKTTVSLRDEFTANRLTGSLSSLKTRLKEALHPGQQATITFDPQTGAARGPDGQPLIKVKRGDQSLYVDPNTNQYYVAKPQNPNIQYFRMPTQTEATGPYSLPPDVQFSNSYFTDADVRKLNWDVNHSPFSLGQLGDVFEAK